MDLSESRHWYTLSGHCGGLASLSEKPKAGPPEMIVSSPAVQWTAGFAVNLIGRVLPVVVSPCIELC